MNSIFDILKIEMFKSKEDRAYDKGHAEGYLKAKKEFDILLREALEKLPIAEHEILKKLNMVCRTRVEEKHVHYFSPPIVYITVLVEPR